jgi:hypothetical protein
MNGHPVSFKLQEPAGFAGPAESFNYLAGIQGAFPWMGPQETSSKGNRIQTIKSDGVVLGGYAHSIIRPFDSVHVPRDFANGERCNWPTYAASKYQKWCNEEDAINYYGMRPLVTPDTYNGWLTTMFNHLVNPGHEVSKLLNADLTPRVFCNTTADNYGSEETVVMKWLMQQIAIAVSVLPQMKKNGPWKYEQFHHTDVQFYAFSAIASGQESAVYKILFNLYNPLRSTATLIECVVINPQNSGNFIIAKMDFVNSGEWKLSNENSPSAMMGFNFGTPKTAQSINLNTSGLPDGSNQDWNYGNVLQKQQFNELGFYEPGQNVQVKAGVPDSLRERLNACSSTMLMTAETPKYSGLNSNNVPVRPNGMPHMVKSDPLLVYNLNKDSSDSLSYVYV